MDRFTEILQKNDLSAKGMTCIGNLFSQNHRDLMLKLANFTQSDINNISKISSHMKEVAQNIANFFYDHLLLIADAKKIILSKDGLLERVKHPLPYGRGFLVHRQDTF